MERAMKATEKIAANRSLSCVASVFPLLKRKVLSHSLPSSSPAMSLLFQCLKSNCGMHRTEWKVAAEDEMNVGYSFLWVLHWQSLFHSVIVLCGQLYMYIPSATYIRMLRFTEKRLCYLHRKGSRTRVTESHEKWFLKGLPLLIRVAFSGCKEDNTSIRSMIMTWYGVLFVCLCIGFFKLSLLLPLISKIIKEE